MRLLWFVLYKYTWNNDFGSCIDTVFDIHVNPGYVLKSDMIFIWSNFIFLSIDTLILTEFVSLAIKPTH